VDVHAELDADSSRHALFAWVDDLGRYPQWLEIVPRAEPTASEANELGPAWIVDLRGRLGPLARTKRLRMVRTSHEPDTSVTFERREVDGRSHSPWVLHVEVADVGDDAEQRSRLAVQLHYGGRFTGTVLERLLRDEIERSRKRLRELAESGPPNRVG
jgi:hypothetical protein